MLERNIFDIPTDQIRDVRVAMTVAGGRMVYRAGQAHE
jgi:predicted amidohydrolase YtcJ